MVRPVTAGCVAAGHQAAGHGHEVGVKSTETGVPCTAVSACSISPVWRWVRSPYGWTVSLASAKRLGALSPRPRPEMPDAALTMRPVGSARPVARSGASASVAAVG